MEIVELERERRHLQRELAVASKGYRDMSIGVETAHQVSESALQEAYSERERLREELHSVQDPETPASACGSYLSDLFWSQTMAFSCIFMTFHAFFMDPSKSRCRRASPPRGAELAAGREAAGGEGGGSRVPSRTG